jgi:hypothetical protein
MSRSHNGDCHCDQAKQDGKPDTEGKQLTSLTLVESLKNFTLNAKHFFFVFWFGVVVTKQVQDSVGGEQEQFIDGLVTGCRSLRGSNRRAKHDVA